LPAFTEIRFIFDFDLNVRHRMLRFLYNYNCVNRTQEFTDQKSRLRSAMYST
jgi:hypothetical protein